MVDDTERPATKLAPTDETVGGFAGPPREGRRDEFPREWPRYEYVDFLGEGAMGIVFKARDTTLRRLCAIKLVRGADPGDALRLRREATAQARIEHARVCKVYEVGEIDGRPFVAMQLIEGSTLSQMQPLLNLPEKLRVMREVCEALAAAHALGIVHRDLKPTNIMCERRGDGELLPFVMDFGLARDPREVTLTRSNAILGTPAYMSPEQARGDHAAVDARSDVYGLGATLYALVSGRPPFDSPSLPQLMARVLAEPPPRLGRVAPSLPADVETIVMKCLEKDPARRYASACALGEDLGRFLDGRPILARPPSRLYRARLFLMRHRAIAAVSAAAAALSLGLAGSVLQARLEARRLSSLATRFGREATEIEQSMRVASLMPEHDLTRDREAVRRRLAVIAEDVAREGRLARGPGEYALARGHLVLGLADQARDELERAWAAGYRSPDVAYALGAAWELSWQNDHDEAAREGADERDRRRENEARDRAASWLARARGAAIVDAALLEAKIDYVVDKLPEARREAQLAFARDPLLYEARLLEGRASSKLGHKLAGHGDLAAARAEYSRAEMVLVEASQIARSDPETLFQLCRLYDRMLEISSESASSELAIGACRRAVRVDPSSDAALGKLAIALNRDAELALAAGRDAAALVDESRRAAERAVALQPRFINHYRVLANSLRLQRDYDGALAAVARGLEANPDPRSAQKLELTAARVELSRGRELLSKGLPAAPAATAMLAAIGRARAWVDDYRVVSTMAAARVLVATVADRRDLPERVAEARAAIADALALTHEETPELRALTVELDHLSIRRKP